MIILNLMILSLSLSLSLSPNSLAPEKFSSSHSWEEEEKEEAEKVGNYKILTIESKWRVERARLVSSLSQGKNNRFFPSLSPWSRGVFQSISPLRYAFFNPLSSPNVKNLCVCARERVKIPFWMEKKFQGYLSLSLACSLPCPPYIIKSRGRQLLLLLATMTASPQSLYPSSSFI